MNAFNVSRLKLNDSHTYYGGAIGNIAYNQMAALARLDGIHLESAVTGTDLESPPPASLEFFEAANSAAVERRLIDRLADVDVASYLYFHEPEYDPITKTVVDHELPLVIGMCEVPHPRFRDEVSGLEALPLVRKVGKKLVMPRFERTIRRCDRLVVVDDHAREYYSDYVPKDRIDVVPYGVDLERFTPGPWPDVPRILMVTRLIERRGIDYMIKALPAISSAVAEVELHVVGDGPRRGHLEETARNLGVRGRITFHGNVDSTRLAGLYRRSRVFAHLSLADGWNQPALEAMASGRPVLCTDKPHNSMVVEGETGRKVPWGDPGAVADAAIDLLADPARAETLGQRGRELAEGEYDWPSIAERYLAVLEDVRS